MQKWFFFWRLKYVKVNFVHLELLISVSNQNPKMHFFKTTPISKTLEISMAIHKTLYMKWLPPMHASLYLRMSSETVAYILAKELRTIFPLESTIVSSDLLNWNVPNCDNKQTRLFIYMLRLKYPLKLKNENKFWEKSSSLPSSLVFKLIFSYLVFNANKKQIIHIKIRWDRCILEQKMNGL